MHDICKLNSIHVLFPISRLGLYSNSPYLSTTSILLEPFIITSFPILIYFLFLINNGLSIADFLPNLLNVYLYMIGCILFINAIFRS